MPRLLEPGPERGPKDVQQYPQGHREGQPAQDPAGYGKPLPGLTEDLVVRAIVLDKEKVGRGLDFTKPRTLSIFQNHFYKRSRLKGSLSGTYHGIHFLHLTQLGQAGWYAICRLYVEAAVILIMITRYDFCAIGAHCQDGWTFHVFTLVSHKQLTGLMPRDLFFCAFRQTPSSNYKLFIRSVHLVAAKAHFRRRTYHTDSKILNSLELTKLQIV